MKSATLHVFFFGRFVVVVAEGVVPSAGLFDVKLLKQGRSLGITINGGKTDGSRYNGLMPSGCTVTWPENLLHKNQQ